MLQPKPVMCLVVLLFSALLWIALSTEKEIHAIAEAGSQPEIVFTFEKFHRGTQGSRHGIVGDIKRIGTAFYEDITLTVTGRDRKGTVTFTTEQSISPLWLTQYPRPILVETDVRPSRVNTVSYRVRGQKSSITTNERAVEYMAAFFRMAQATCKSGGWLTDNVRDAAYTDNLQNLYYGDMGNIMIGHLPRELADACMVWEGMTPTQTNWQQPPALTPYMGYVFYPDLTVDRTRNFGIFGIPVGEEYGTHCYWIDRTNLYKRPMDFSQHDAPHPRLASPLVEPDSWTAVGFAPPL